MTAAAIPRRYQVKSIFGPTLQGEGLHAGAPCVFLRLAGCNAWDGRLETRANSACPYCDTDFRGGELLDVGEILARLEKASYVLRPASCVPENPSQYGCVLTGGEPLLQADSELLAALGERFAWVDIETNGTRVCPSKPANVFVSCSPKYLPSAPIVVEPDWWKILIPDQERFLAGALASGKPVFVQPTCPDAGPHGPAYENAVRACIDLCYQHGCRLSVQLHKQLGIE